MDAPAKVRVPPNSKEAEMMVLGCMLTSINSLNIAAERLVESDFYFSEHKIIFRCLQDAYKSDRPADIHLVAEELKRQDTLQIIGGIVYLTSLAQYAGTSAYIEEYAEVVKNKSVLRQMVSSAQHVEKHALEEPQDVDCALDEAQQLFFRIGQTRNPQAGTLVCDILSGRDSESSLSFLKELETRQERYMRLGAEATGITGIPTNFVDLDRVINGLSNSHLVILASRPAMGKTALALNIAENVSFRNNIPVGIFSLEMTAEQLVHRIVCSQSEVESTKIRTGSLTPMEFHQVVESVNEIQQHTIIIDDQPGLKITDLRARARRMKESYKVGLIVIDYLQLISGSGSAKTIENRQNEISEISRMLKILAREIDIPIICLSQLSRRVEERTGHRPIMSDLRESGCLTGDTLIRDATSGEIHTMQELAKRSKQDPMFVHSMEPDLKIGSHTMAKAFYSGKKTVYELKTRSGRTIKASANHPFLRIDGWTPLEKLRVGEKLAIPRKIVCEKAPSSVTEEEIALVRRFDLDVIPKEAWNTVVEAAKEKFGLTWEDIQKGLGLPYCGSTLFESGISQQRMEQLEAILPSAELRNLAHSDVYWDEIVSITELGKEDVYDLTVEGTHNFVANDIIVHNSIEQDADVVIFLLRREYYDPYDRPGQAELIIAKNRHGGIGNITLTYRKEIAQFANFSQVSQGGENGYAGERPEAREPDFAAEPG